MAGSKKSGKVNYVVVASSHGGTDGTYSSKRGPQAAASKAATQRFNKTKTDKLRITIRETGTDRKFTYDVKRVKLAKPVETVIKGVKIVRQYENKVVPVKE